MLLFVETRTPSFILAGSLAKDELEIKVKKLNKIKNFKLIFLIN